MQQSCLASLVSEEVKRTYLFSRRPPTPCKALLGAAATDRKAHTVKMDILHRVITAAMYLGGRFGRHKMRQGLEGREARTIRFDHLNDVIGTADRHTWLHTYGSSTRFF